MFVYTLGIDGMKCGMCEAHVNDLIRRNFEIKKVKASHRKNQVLVLSKTKIDEEKLRAVIAESGYRLLSFSFEEK